MYARSSAIARLAVRLLGTRLQAASSTLLAFRKRCDGDGLRGSLCRLLEGDAGLHIDVVADVYLILSEWSSTPSASTPSLPTKRLEKVVKREICSKSAGASKTAATAKSTKATSTAEWAASAKPASSWPWSAALVESSISKLVILCPLLLVREELIGRLSLSKFILGCWVLVGIWVELLRQAVVCLLDFRSTCALVDAENLVGILVLLCS